MSAALHIEQLSKVYTGRGAPFKALDNVSLSVEPGEFFGLLGPNGAGKTTLISILAGLARATGGKVRICGYDVHDEFRQARRALGVVPQEIAFDPFFTVRETLRNQSGYFGLKNNDDWIEELTSALGLTDKADANMRALSGGMKRRVLVAQALVHKPPVIVLDEPTAGVDVELRQTLWKFVSRLNAQGHTIVLTTHYLEEAQELCSRIAMLKSGQVVALDKTPNLLARMQGARLNVRLRQGTVPEHLRQQLVSEAHQRASFKLASHHEVEPMLAALRQAGLQIEELEVQPPDLEDVFVRIMSSEPTAHPTPV